MSHRKQEGWITKKSGWWVLRYRERVLLNDEPETIQKSKRLVPIDPEHKTKRSVLADQNIRRVIAETLEPVNQRHTPEMVVMVGGFVDTVYLPFVKTTKRPSTYVGYRDLWRAHLKSRCEGLWLQNLRTFHLQRLLDKVAKEDGLSKTTMKHVKHFLSGVFRYAAQQDYFDRPNPVTPCSIPDAPRAGETYAYSLDEIGAMLEVLPEPAATVVAVAGFTGLRRGELRGLRWEDYTPASNGSMATLRIARSIWRRYETEPKTTKSKAPVPVIAPVAERIEAYRAQIGKAATTGSMFTNTAGRPLDLNELYQNVLKDIFKLKRIAWHGWHAFRRGLATNLKHLGVDDKIIQAILRHSTISTTQNIYIKEIQADVVAAMKRLEKAFAGKRKPAPVAWN
jgi:integrase